MEMFSKETNQLNGNVQNVDLFMKVLHLQKNVHLANIQKNIMNQHVCVLKMNAHVAIEEEKENDRNKSLFNRRLSMV